VVTHGEKGREGGGGATRSGAAKASAPARVRVRQRRQPIGEAGDWWGCLAHGHGDRPGSVACLRAQCYFSINSIF
jgi:hypothetical protein